MSGCTCSTRCKREEHIDNIVGIGLENSIKQIKVELKYLPSHLQKVKGRDKDLMMLLSCYAYLIKGGVYWYGLECLVEVVQSGVG